MTSSTPSITELLSRIETAGKHYDDQDLGARETLLDLSRQSTACLEFPSGTIAYSGTKCGVNEYLIRRILQHLAASSIITFHDGKYHATPLSTSLTESKFESVITFTYDFIGPIVHQFPEYFAKSNYKKPVSVVDSPFQYTYNTNTSIFEWLDANLTLLISFNLHMTGWRESKAIWCDPGFYPVHDRLIHGFDASISDVFLVDLGGGLGHDFERLVAQYPSLPGKLVLQDREEVISSRDDSYSGAYEAHVHDFFTPQRVYGARVYYLHCVLHDWNDEDCVRILENLRHGLRKGYSRLLINEVVVAVENPARAATSMDLLMLAMGARERTRADWEMLLDRAGFRVGQIYNFPGSAESLIEGELL